MPSTPLREIEFLSPTEGWGVLGIGSSCQQSPLSDVVSSRRLPSAQPRGVGEPHLLQLRGALVLCDHRRRGRLGDNTRAPRSCREGAVRRRRVRLGARQPAAAHHVGQRRLLEELPMPSTPQPSVGDRNSISRSGVLGIGICQPVAAVRRGEQPAGCRAPSRARRRRTTPAATARSPGTAASSAPRRRWSRRCGRRRRPSRACRRRRSPTTAGSRCRCRARCRWAHRSGRRSPCRWRRPCRSPWPSRRSSPSPSGRWRWVTRSSPSRSRARWRSRRRGRCRCRCWRRRTRAAARRRDAEQPAPWRAPRGRGTW